jgi:hypothetical protein
MAEPAARCGLQVWCHTSGMGQSALLEQGKLSMSPTRFVERIDLATPRFALTNRTSNRTTACAQRRPSNPAAPSPTWPPGRNPIHLL